MDKKTHTQVSRSSAAALTDWRERMGFSQRDAATALGCSRAAWGGWESGKQKAPRYIGLACDALALGIKPDAAFDTADPENDAA
jgi:transcriptional regulator with XRE-family HTH domain